MSYPLVLTNSLTSASVCEMMVSSEMTVMDVCKQASELCSDTTAVDIVVVKDTNVIDGEISLRELGLDKGGLATCLKMTPINAQTARRNAKLARASHEQFLPALPRNLSFEPFGEKLATDVALNLKARKLLQGRVKIDFRMGLMSISHQEVWSLGADIPTENKEEFALVWRFGMDELMCWTRIEDFVEFWAEMSEKRIAALMGGINTSLDSVISINGAVTRTQLEQLVRTAPVVPVMAKHAQPSLQRK